MRRHREREAHQHAAGIAFDGGVDKLLHTRKVHDLLELASNLRLAHAQDGAVEIDVLAPSKLGMKASTDLEQTGDAASDGDTSLVWLGDARQDLQERRLACAIAPDDAEHLPALNLEVHVL